MALRINVLQYNRFVFRYRLTLLERKTGPICLVLVGLMAGRLTDETWVGFEFLKSSTG